MPFIWASGKSGGEGESITRRLSTLHAVSVCALTPLGGLAQPLRKESKCCSL